ncbi:MAG: bifunctional demethylmenaquinone methyltransferase/2-methoxy-6-polyprenyl-1,4-benzoquinol methylase UbiE [Rhodocyclaceae bacterium]|nr:bifunctional demethylmenaquinone methyltransferase/2-methoxy-6-polyprenyl-1,4-benzoquinol methylase UbiE [Rhodocyclaceae bacterium]MCA4904770.1 bifunctional demethylmenaquinone methyltransferase/2-methoxy-6-polyprenyl-1,4-benzoquinol methylase UbiE [Rhodocyclaceae bacterium]
MTRKVDFGFESVAEEEKARRVAGVFDSVADRYDLMNDLMSGGMHRLWKRFTIDQSGVRPGQKVLDIAGGTGDLARAFQERVGPAGTVLLTDINASMLARGRDRMLDEGRVIEVVRCDAERLPFPDCTFDCVSVAFGLRNMTHKDRALAEMFRVLRPGGRLLVLEFSKVWSPLDPLYRLYTMKLLPAMGKVVANDSASYRYLAESIAKHPDQETLRQLMVDAGFERVEYFNLSAGVVALHRGHRL